MPSLIEQLQQEALDPSTAIADLLRKTKLVAVKLEKGDALTWVHHELNGYPKDAQLPAYRVVVGQPKIMNLVIGWQPLVITHPETNKAASTRHVRQAVSALAALLEGGSDELILPYPVDILREFERTLDVEIAGAGCSVGRSAVVAILDAVRTRVLDWALELWKAGVRGEGTVAFSSSDREAAKHVTYNISVGGSVTGNVGEVSGHAIVNATHTGQETVQVLSRLADEIQQHAASMGLREVDRSLLESRARELKEEVSRPEPDAGRLGHVLGTIKSIAEIAAGDLVAAGILHVLARPEIAALILRVMP